MSGLARLLLAALTAISLTVIVRHPDVAHRPPELREAQSPVALAGAFVV